MISAILLATGQSKRIRGENRLLKKYKVESLAIVFINSYVNQIHEEKIKKILQKKIPSLYLTTY